MPQLTLKSERAIQSQMMATLSAQLGLSDINPGSAIDIITQAASQSDFNILFQISQVARLADIEALTRDELDLKAFEFGLQRATAQNATGVISVLRPAAFVKVSTNFSSANNFPIAGSLTIDVNDASDALFGSLGTLILGRGTNNEEEVGYSIAPANNVSFWTFVLDAPGLINNHSPEETVILKQGLDEVILSGTVVRVLANGIQPEIQFSISNDITLFAGEARLDGVGVTALQPGEIGNISSGSIEGTEAFPSPPFPDARAENSSKFTSGRDLETDDSLRDRIRFAGDTLTKGVKNAILTAVVGLVDTDSAKRVVSASVVLPIEVAGPVKVYIDDGTGFEPTFDDRGFETVRSSLAGGEQRLQLDNFPIQKASVENTTSETYDMSTAGLVLDYQVGIIQEIVTFDLSDFAAPDIATAEEVVAAINDKASIIEARTSQVGRFIILTARADINEEIQIIGGTANAILNFPTSQLSTINLYRDDVNLSKDGLTAIIDSGGTAPFNLAAVAGGLPVDMPLVINIDGKTSNQTALLTAADVVDPNAVTPAEIAAVINRDVSGVVASPIENNARVRLISNTELSLGSRIRVISGTLNDAVNGLDFNTVEVVGRAADFRLNRELGIVELATPLAINEVVTAGSLFTRAKIRAVLPELYVAANGSTLIISVDGGADQTITFDGSFVAGLTAAASAAFINLQLSGAEAIVRQVGSVNFLEIRSNTFAITGTIEVKSTSTGNIGFQFPEDAPNSSDEPNAAFVASQNVSPFAFSESDVLIVVVDQNIAGAFSIPMGFAGTVTTGTSTTAFTASALNNTFLTQDEIVDFFVAFTSGANTTTGAIPTVTAQGGGVFRYGFGAPPANFPTDYAIGDLSKISGLANVENNGTFVIQAVDGAGLYIDVQNPIGINAVAQVGTAVLSQKRQADSYNQVSGAVTVSAPFANVPGLDGFILLPSTVTNLVDYTNNIRISPVSLQANIEGVENNTRLQISSKSLGSEGAIQIPSSGANSELDFSTSLIKGVAGYNFWIGLVKLVHRTVYGDDTDLVAFPGVGAAGITFQILAPTVRQIQVSLDVTLVDGIVSTALENEIKSQVGAYVNSLGVGVDVVIERIRAAVIGVAGVEDVVITNPTANISAADQELIRVSDPSIVVG